MPLWADVLLADLSRGENVGVPSRCGPVRRRGTTEFGPSIRSLGQGDYSDSECRGI